MQKCSPGQEPLLPQARRTVAPGNKSPSPEEEYFRMIKVEKYNNNSLNKKTPYPLYVPQKLKNERT